jgi:predicted metal-dependent HD superfamily phosphohydrolase
MSLDFPSIAARWAPLLDGLPDPDALVAALAPRYAEPHRAYHGISHIDALARLYLDVAAGPRWQTPHEVQLATLFHDAIYEPGRPDNEDRSAELARAHLQSSGLDIERIAAMIRATKTHDHLPDPDDHDLAHFIDADMSIIGAPAPVYDAYAKAVRQEFSAIPSELFARGRKAFLAAQLARDHLFHTPWFRARYQAHAQQNLARELAGF